MKKLLLTGILFAVGTLHAYKIKNIVNDLDEPVVVHLTSKPHSDAVAVIGAGKTATDLNLKGPERGYIGWSWGKALFGNENYEEIRIDKQGNLHTKLAS